MNNNDEEILKVLQFLVERSRILLQEQLKSYQSTITKAGILTSIAALLISIAIIFISSTETLPIIKYLTITPTFLMIVAIIYLFRVLMSEGLYYGFNFEQFDNQLENTYEGLLLFEIGANRDSYSDNTPIVRQQNINFNTSLKFMLRSAITTFIIVIVNLFCT